MGGNNQSPSTVKLGHTPQFTLTEKGYRIQGNYDRTFIPFWDEINRAIFILLMQQFCPWSNLNQVTAAVASKLIDGNLHWTLIPELCYIIDFPY